MGVGDITTVYKFNTFGDGESVKYLNTCIAASFQENDQGLPLFNITADTPLPESTIPPLYDGHNATRWELMMNNGTTVPILVPDYANITSDYSESLFQSDFSFGAKVEGINRGKSLKTKTAPRSTDTLNLFTSNEIVNTEQILLRVTFQRTPQVIIKLIHEEHYILITLDSVLLSACYYHKNGVLVTPCYEGTGYSSGGEINFFITLKSELFIYDQTASKVHVTNVVPNGTLSSIKQERGRYVSARDHLLISLVAVLLGLLVSSVKFNVTGIISDTSVPRCVPRLQMNAKVWFCVHRTTDVPVLPVIKESNAWNTVQKVTMVQTARRNVDSV
ncbi:hypothetical protein M8J75_004158 [Diaphorina citri]|nr:hypothetical protein M8J75_004158 [Diaphorina citri]